MEFVKMKDGVPQNQRMHADDWWNYAELVKGDECPEGFLPVRKVLPRPEPTGKQRLAWTYTPVNGEMVKDYFLERTYGVYRLVVALKSLTVSVDDVQTNALQPAIAWVKEHGLYEELMTIGEIRDDDTDLMGAIAALGQEFDLSDDEIAAILEQCEI